jgi:hypothetical protein
MPSTTRPSLIQVATELGRTPEAVQEFLRRLLPPGQRPWREKPRWTREELDALENGHKPVGRSKAAVRKYCQRHRPADDGKDDHAPLTVTQVAEDLGVSRATVYRYLKRGLLRRFKGGVAETSFEDLLREHPHAVPYHKLPVEQKEWLVLNGYHDPNMEVKRPSVRGLLE